jgi:hypothetical protein
MLPQTKSSSPGNLEENAGGEPGSSRQSNDLTNFLYDADPVDELGAGYPRFERSREWERGYKRTFITVLALQLVPNGGRDVKLYRA